MKHSHLRTPCSFIGALCAIVTLSCCASLAAAREASSTVTQNIADKKQALPQLNKMVVTATRTPKLLEDSPVSVTVVSGDALRQVAQTTLARALDFIPGVVVKRSTKDGYNVFMQGFDGDRVLVLVDGRRLIAPTGASVDLDQISVANIERIEIVRGAGSVLYGSSAMGGVINIITRKGTGNRLSVTSEASFYVGNEIEGDEIGYQHRVEVGANLGAWRTGLQVQQIDDVGFDYQPETVAQTAATIDKKFTQFSLGRDFESFSGDYRAQVFDEKKYRDSYKLPGQSAVIYYLSDVQQVQHDIEFRNRPANESERTQDGSWQLSARYTDHQEQSGQSTCLRDTDIALSELDGQRVWQGAGYEWVGGFASRHDQLNQMTCAKVIEIDNQSATGTEAFTQYSWLAADYEILSGVRVQHDSDFDWHSAVRVSAMKKIAGSKDSQWHLRGGLGQSYRVPTLKERFYVFDHSNLGYMVLGNPALQPETAITGNASVSYLRALQNDAGIFESEFNIHYSDANHLIDTLRDDAASVIPSANIGHLRN